MKKPCKSRENSAYGWIPWIRREGRLCGGRSHSSCLRGCRWTPNQASRSAWRGRPTPPWHGSVSAPSHRPHRRRREISRSNRPTRRVDPTASSRRLVPKAGMIPGDRSSSEGRRPPCLEGHSNPSPEMGSKKNLDLKTSLNLQNLLRDGSGMGTICGFCAPSPWKTSWLEVGQPWRSPFYRKGTPLSMEDQLEVG